MPDNSLVSPVWFLYVCGLAGIMACNLHKFPLELTQIVVSMGFNVSFSTLGEKQSWTLHSSMWWIPPNATGSSPTLTKTNLFLLTGENNADNCVSCESVCVNNCKCSFHGAHNGTVTREPSPTSPSANQKHLEYFSGCVKLPLKCVLSPMTDVRMLRHLSQCFWIFARLSADQLNQCC